MRAFVSRRYSNKHHLHPNAHTDLGQCFSPGCAPDVVGRVIVASRTPPPPHPPPPPPPPPGAAPSSPLPLPNPRRPHHATSHPPPSLTFVPFCPAPPFFSPFTLRSLSPFSLRPCAPSLPVPRLQRYQFASAPPHGSALDLFPVWSHQERGLSKCRHARTACATCRGL